MKEFLSGIFYSSISLVFLIAAAAVIFFLVSLSRMKRQKEHFKRIHLSLKEGSRIVFLGGIYGTVVKVAGDMLDVKIKSGAVMTVSRYAVSELVGE